MLNEIVAAFGAGVDSNTHSAYIVSNTSTGSASGTLKINAKDRSNAHHGKAVKFTTSSDLGLGDLHINTIVDADDTLAGEDIVIILESKTSGLSLTDTGNPETSIQSLGTSAGSGGGEGETLITIGTSNILELHNLADDLSASNSVTNEGKNSTKAAKNTDRTSWLAG